jgi:hypothetical protein
MSRPQSPVSANALGTVNVLGSGLSNVLSGLLAPIDRVRRSAYKIGGRPFVELLRDPQRRTFWLSLGYLTTALLATLLWPLGLLAVGPVLWGIPHILGDVRYLVVRPGFQRNTLRLVLVSAALLAAMVGGGIVAGVVAVLIAIVTSNAPWRARLALFVPGLAALAVVAWERRASELVFAHLHNAVAVAWLVASFRRMKHRLLLVLAFLVAVALLFCLPLGPVPLWPGGLDGMDWGYHLGVLTPGAASPFWVRLVLLFAFAQAFHYAVWMRLVPELERKRRAPRSFRASYAALNREFGTWPMLLVCAAMVALAIGSLWALRDSRETYLRFALFHGYLELAFLSVAWLELRRAPGSGAGLASA